LLYAKSENVIEGEENREADMNVITAVQPKNGAIIRDIEKAVDAANMLALDMAINAFESEDIEAGRFQDMNTIRSMTEKGLLATGEIGRLLSGFQIF
jgi:hypothetical protein